MGCPGNSIAEEVLRGIMSCPRGARWVMAGAALLDALAAGLSRLRTVKLFPLPEISKKEYRFKKLTIRVCLGSLYASVASRKPGNPLKKEATLCFENSPAPSSSFRASAYSLKAMRCSSFFRDPDRNSSGISTSVEELGTAKTWATGKLSPSGVST